MAAAISGKAFVLGDDVDTDQIIPAEYLVYSLADQKERRFYAKFALSGVPKERLGLPSGYIPFVLDEKEKADYSILVAGRNFGCGSSREHAPFALREAGIKVVIAEFYARIFYRNAVNGGYLIPYESEKRMVETIRTGDDLEILLDENKVRNITTGEILDLRPLGEIAGIVQAGDLFAYARNKV